MCQQYENERKAIVASEQRASRRGFIAAHRGKAKHENPYNGEPWAKRRKESWDHGWSCFHSHVLPWGVELKLRNKFGISKAIKIRNQFVKDGTITEELESVI